MFVPPDFSPPEPPRRSSQQQARVIGALLLVVVFLLLLVMSLGLDATIFTPYNATHAPTLTYRAKHPTTPTPRPQFPFPRATRTPVIEDSQVNALGHAGS